MVQTKSLDDGGAGRRSLIAITTLVRRGEARLPSRAHILISMITTPADAAITHRPRA
jgi:hypothetical protein